jgi:hypothetical protein
MKEQLLAVGLGGTIGGGSGLGNLSAPGSDAPAMLGRVISSIVGVMTVAAGIWFLFQILIGGYTWLSSMGDKQRLETARNRIVHSLIGLVIVVAAVAIVSLTGQFLGYDILNSQDILENLQFN